jgi:hypothetical protein
VSYGSSSLADSATAARHLACSETSMRTAVSFSIENQLEINLHGAN